MHWQDVCCRSVTQALAVLHVILTWSRDHRLFLQKSLEWNPNDKLCYCGSLTSEEAGSDFRPYAFHFGEREVVIEGK